MAKAKSVDLVGDFVARRSAFGATIPPDAKASMLRAAPGIGLDVQGRGAVWRRTGRPDTRPSRVLRGAKALVGRNVLTARSWFGGRVILARRVISLPRGNPVAFGPKQTSGLILWIHGPVYFV
jgi:hypothetical protein